MSLFVESICKFEGDTICYQLLWSKFNQIAALITNTVDENDREIFNVMFMNNEGVLLKNHTIKHDKEAISMDWIPNGDLLAIGWKDGLLSCWEVDGTKKPVSTFSNTSQHNSAIMKTVWSPNGKRLITGDKRGLISVWSLSNKKTLSLTYQYRKQGIITSVVFCPIKRLPSKTDGRKKKSDPRQGSTTFFFFGTDKGLLACADDAGTCSDRQQLSSSVDNLLYIEEKATLVCITRSLIMMQFQVTEDGNVNRLSHGKLSTQADMVDKGLESLTWVGPGLLALATHEKMVRIYDLIADETYNLSLTVLGDIVDRNDQVYNIAFNPVDRYLAVGTRGGVLAIWRYIGPVRDISSVSSATATASAAATATAVVVASNSSDWELYSKVTLPSTIHQLDWSCGHGALGVILEDNVFVFSETILRCGNCGDVSVLQVNSNEVSVTLGTAPFKILSTDMIIRGIGVGKSCFVVLSGRAARVFSIDVHEKRVESFDPFHSSAHSVAIGDTSSLVDSAVFLAEEGKIYITNFKGVRKGAISFSEGEGRPEHLDIHAKYLAAMTDKGILKIFDVSQPNKPKAMGSAINFFKSVVSSSGGEEAASTMKIRSIHVNCDGSRIAVLVDHELGALKVRHPNQKLHIYDRNCGGVTLYDFSKQMKCPVLVAWDDSDDRLIAVEAHRDRSNQALTASSSSSSSSSSNASSKDNNSSSNSNSKPDTRDSTSASLLNYNNYNNSKTPGGDIEGDFEVEIIMLFATSDHGILLQDSFPSKFPYGQLLGVSVPKIFFRSAPPVLSEGDDPEVLAKLAAESHSKVYSKMMRDFVGLETVLDDQSKLALIEFSYNVTLGKLDEAYRSVKTIESPSIWENMAHMCVKTKRLDVAEICLGNMGHARGAAALRIARADKYSSLESNIGILAIQLGLLDDAARLFREAGRYDLLNKLYQSTGLWEKAIHTATNNDRIRLKNTYYQYAKFLESIGDTVEASKNFENSDTFRTEVPRMLYNLGYMDDLELYIQKSTDITLLKWWAAYLESKENFDRAKKYYSKANDYLSLVRINCYQDDMVTAAAIVTESGDKAAAYHLARQLEAKGDLPQAILHYASSECFNHAIRLAKVYNMDSDLMRFALKASPSLMLDCASHFEEKNEYEKAILLYHKGGDLGKALDLCFRGAEALNVTIKGRSKPDTSKSQGIFEMMNDIAADLGANTSPQTLARCAEFLMQHRQYERAIDLYIMAKRYTQAIEMCSSNNIQITEEMAEKLTPKVTEESPESSDSTDRKDILKILAKALKIQGSYIVASRKYTQAGDRVRAIKCLVKSGDTKAVIQFATITRNNEIFKLAANYLQQMNWRESVDIMKAIISFYTKAKAFEQLAGFYDSCAQVEIDEYRDYDKAQGALKEALKYLQKAESKHAEMMTENINRRLELIEKFSQARKLYDRNPGAMVEMCLDLLRARDLEEAIRSGDCYALLIEYYHTQQEFQQAYQLISDMENKGIDATPYIEAKILDDIYRKLGISKNKSAPKKSQAADSKASNESKGQPQSKQQQQQQQQQQQAKDQEEDHERVGSDLDEEIDEEIGEEFENEEKSPPKGKYRSGGGGGYAQQRYPSSSSRK